HGPAVALHLRGPRTPTRTLHAIAAALVPVARASGGILLVNDRVDVALAVDAHGAQLGGRSLPAVAVRRLREDWILGASVHGLDALGGAAGADFLVLGTIWATPSHPGREGAGPSLIRAVRAQAGLPVIAIGGVTPERVPEARRAGARGVAVLRGIWSRPDAVLAAGEYVEAWMDETRDDA
ncbi:MAG: thiamine phosphate synthase, partial [Gemmatimonadota bacterium]